MDSPIIRYTISMTQVSVIIATKNGAAFISKAIQSVFDQTFATDPLTRSQLEVIVVDDGSTDTTPQIVTDLATFEPRLKLLQMAQNMGPGKARDHGIKASVGAYIAFIDDDDLWLDPRKLQTQYDFLEAHHEHVLVGASTVRLVKEDGSLIRVHRNVMPNDQIRKAMLGRNCFATSSVLFRKETYLKVGGFKPMYLSEDYDLWFRMGIEGKFANLDGCDIQYTLRKNNASSTKALEMNKINIALVKEYKNHYPGYMMGIIRAYARVFYLYIKNLF